MKKIIASPAAPKAVGPYSQAVQADATLYVSGQLPIDAATGRIRDLSNGAEITCPPLPQSMAAILSKGGLVGYVKERLARG